MATTAFKSPLHETVSTTATDYWNDSCSIEELTYALEHGAVGATSNPTIVGEVLAKELDLWRDRIAAIVAEHPAWTEDEVTWQLIEEMAVKASELLLPVFEREGGRKGRLSIQTNPKLYRDADRIREQALRFGGLAPNMQVKIPATRAGIAAIEEVTAAGVNVNATVCFTVPQALAVGAAVERGLERREAEGHDVSGMTPVCTIMVGRLDDWLEVAAGKQGTLLTPGDVNWAGIACIKKAYGIYVERGYRARLLAAAYRHHRHWSELIGGDIVLTIPYKWQRLINASDVEVKPRFDDPVPAEIVDSLYRLLPDFRRAYDADGLAVEEFDSYGATVRTLRGFIASYQDLVGRIRDFMLPDPDR
ncbi:MAG TPA: transaldolase family protein [Gaiellaceae bacterium]|jgi:transaldolase|nr:transaldolase family protein [Gaiellaceae bacterium]